MDEYLVDTNTISEFSKPMPNQGVVDWLRHTDPSLLYSSVITFGEIRLGIEDLPIGKRRADLETWFLTGLPTWFSGKTLPVTSEIADRWAKITIQAKQRGRTVATPDGLIAATALVHNLVIVTRNVSDFEPLGVPVLSPWK